MFKKICHRCQKTSYSLSEEGQWICPGCGINMTDQPIVSRETGTTNVLPVKSSNIEGPILN